MFTSFFFNKIRDILKFEDFFRYFTFMFFEWQTYIKKQKLVKN